MRLSLPQGAKRGLTAFAIALTMGVFAPEFVVAQSKSEAQLTVRVQELEDTVRNLTGQIEGLQFALTQLQEQLAKMQQDNEFRFQELEGGAGKKPEAATQDAGATPVEALPQADTATDTTALPAPEPLAADTNAAGDPVVNDGLGDSADPLLGTNQAGEGTLGTLDENALGTRPLDLTLDSGQQLSDGDANAQYQAGYDALVRGDYAFAEDQLTQFIALYPDNPQAAEATNWLGEALLQQQKYAEAADVLTTGYQNYSNSPRTPDIMLRLGEAMNGAGEPETACRLFFEVSRRFPNQPTAFKQKLKSEQAAAQCQVQ
ncbi:MAG: tol-pal system protein YbgF [Devosia sp.]